MTYYPLQENTLQVTHVIAPRIAICLHVQVPNMYSSTALSMAKALNVVQGRGSHPVRMSPVAWPALLPLCCYEWPTLPKDQRNVLSPPPSMKERQYLFSSSAMEMSIRSIGNGSSGGLDSGQQTPRFGALCWTKRAL